MFSVMGFLGILGFTGYSRLAGQGAQGDLSVSLQCLAYRYFTCVLGIGCTSLCP